MNFTTHKDIDAPIAFVFQKISNFETYEKQALRRGAQVDRVDGGGPVRVGAAWDVAFKFRGKDRKLRATITKIAAPERLEVDTAATGLNSTMTVDLVALSPKTTRVSVSIDLSAKSLSARLVLQSLKLAKNNLDKRFAKRVGEQVKGIAEDYRKSR